MSSTNRGAVRQNSDYYVTPQEHIRAFIEEWAKDEPGLAMVRSILDPCAGGTMGENGAALVEMSYPSVLRQSAETFKAWPRVHTMDIRPDSLAEHKADYLQAEYFPENAPELIITNPPFALAQEIINKALRDVGGGGGWL